MTTRQTALALLAFFAGFGMLFLLDGTVSTKRGMETGRWPRVIGGG